MPRLLQPAIALLVLGFTASAFGQTREELLKENDELKARLKALEAKLEASKDAHKHDHDHDHKDKSHAKNDPCKPKKPKDQFDFFRPFHSHCDQEEHENGNDHEAAGHDREKGRDQAHDHEQASGDGHANGNGHHNTEGHDRHESVYGYPFFHALRTEHAFIERKMELQFVGSKGRDSGTLDATALEGELFWALNNRLAVFIEGPFTWRNPDEADNTYGIGDLEFGLQFVAFNSRHLMMSVALGVETPTGNPGRGLGEGHASLEPKFLGLIDFGCGWVLQQDLRLELPIFVEEDVENEFIYNFALGKTILATRNGRFVQWLTPGVELSGRSTLNGGAAGLNILEIMPALFWVAGDKNHFGLGCALPVGGHQDLDYEVRFAWFRHF